MKTITSIWLNQLLFVLPFLLISFSITAQVGIGTTNPLSTFEVNGSYGQKVNTISATVTLDDTFGIVVCNNGSTAITVTLPDVTLCTGRVYTIKRNATSTANVTIAGTIDGVTNLILAKAGDAATLFSNGSEWKAASSSNSSWNLTGNSGTTAGTNFLGTTDATALSIKTNAVEHINVSSAGITTIGSVPNITKIEADGTIVMEGAATVWDDLRVSVDAGSSSAALGYMPGETSGGQIWYFRDAQGLETLTFQAQLPHGYKEGTDIFPHLHWTPRTTKAGNIEWNLDYTWVNYDSTTPLAFPATTTSTVVETGGFTERTHHITSLTTANAGLNGSGKKVSSILICRLWRNSGNAADTYASDAGLLSLDFHYEIDTVGSRLQYIK